MLRSLDFSRRATDAVVTDHALQRVPETLVDYVAARAGARVVVARVLFPLQCDGDGIDDGRCVRALMPRTQLALSTT